MNKPKSSEGKGIKIDELTTVEFAILTNEQLKDFISDEYTFEELINERNSCIKILESIK